MQAAVIYLTIFFLAYDGFISGQLVEQEKLALQDLASSFTAKPPSWSRTDASTACNVSWAGVTCTSDKQHIASIDLTEVCNYGSVGHCRSPLVTFRS